MCPRFVSTTRTSTSFAPPPTFTSIGSFSFAIERISSRWWRIVIRAPWGSETPTSWICPIMIGPDVLAENPPRSRAIRAAFEAAATTLGSSIAIGTR